MQSIYVEYLYPGEANYFSVTISNLTNDYVSEGFEKGTYQQL